MLDAALERYGKLRVRAVELTTRHTLESFLAEFHSTASCLERDERISMEVNCQSGKNIELLRAALSSDKANLVSSLEWCYYGKEDVSTVSELIANNCLGMMSLNVSFESFSAVDFLSSVLEHPGARDRIKVLELPRDHMGDLPRFFAALRQSQVSAMSITGCYLPEYFQQLSAYLESDLLARLWLSNRNDGATLELIPALANCIRLAELTVHGSYVHRPLSLPNSFYNLQFLYCRFDGLANEFDWSFLLDSNVQKLCFDHVIGVDGILLGRALSVRLEARGLEALRFEECRFAKVALAAIGMEIARVERLELDLDELSIEQVSLALQSPGNQLRELCLGFCDTGVDSILVPALRHPNCGLTRLQLTSALPGRKPVLDRIQQNFSQRVALFTLLQGQQVRRLYCPLRRLPVDLLRLVGNLLLGQTQQ
ncbi:hypothetical protein BASA81_001966 [Batrachochytrium salamandrivorans]|nr:hypothetical protein BASA81_001966 [Batrachochytrium salamandrivorans]